ncbi:SMI1/KNR4 family protein [Pseudomonas syringae]|nr:SMI1/KNR4 family protein [Pseudomonas syringae]
MSDYNFCYVVESRFGGPNEWQKIYPAISQINTKAGYIVLEAERDKFSQIKNGVVIMENLKLFLRQKKNDHFFDDLSVIEEPTLKALIESNRKVPKDYIDFMRRYGVGEIRTVSFMLYNGFLKSDDIFDSANADLFKNIAFFGDDMQGYNVGFDRNNAWAVVEVDSSDMSLRKCCDNFSSFLYRLLS